MGDVLAESSWVRIFFREVGDHWLWHLGRSNSESGALLHWLSIRLHTLLLLGNWLGAWVWARLKCLLEWKRPVAEAIHEATLVTGGWREGEGEAARRKLHCYTHPFLSPHKNRSIAYERSSTHIWTFPYSESNLVIHLCLCLFIIRLATWKNNVQEQTIFIQLIQKSLYETQNNFTLIKKVVIPFSQI